MSIQKRWFTLALISFAFSSTSPAHAADHLDAPILQAGGVGDRDINDLYAFQSPANPNNTVLIMTVNPLAGVSSSTSFGDDVTYEFQVDNTGDAIPDITYSTTFGAPVLGVQSLTTLRNGSAFASGTTDANVPVIGGGTIRAGVYDDPFFFDLVGFQNGLAFTGDDFFAGANVSAIVLEIPSSDLAGPNIGIQARTIVGGSQVDRMGRPAINTVLIPDPRKDEFNQADPVNDLSAFGADVEAAITGLSDAANAAALTPILLPDLLTLDTSSSAGFLNGRQLADDVIDAELTLLTGSSSPVGDGVDANDVPFLDVFPYLAPANPIPEPSGLALTVLGLSMLDRRKRSSR